MVRKEQLIVLRYFFAIWYYCPRPLDPFRPNDSVECLLCKRLPPVDDAFDEPTDENLSVNENKRWKNGFFMPAERGEVGDLVVEVAVEMDSWGC